MDYKKIMNKIYQRLNENLENYSEKINDLKLKKRIILNNKFTNKLLSLLVTWLIIDGLLIFCWFVLNLKKFNLEKFQFLIYLLLILAIAGIVIYTIFKIIKFNM